MIKPEDSELTFRRLYIEKTSFRYAKKGEVFLEGVDVITAMWFCDGTILLLCEAQRTWADFEEGVQKTEFFEPPETVVHHGFVQSHAIRLAIAAHDRLLGIVQEKLPKDVERKSR